MKDINELDLESLYARLSEGGLIRRLVALARDEDLGSADGGRAEAAAWRGGGAVWPDVTGLVCIPEGARGEASITARGAFVLAGMRAVPDVLRAIAPDVALHGRAADGHDAEAGQTLAVLAGPMRQIVAAERTILNLLGRLSGVATLTRAYVHAVEGTRARIYDTRKTTPGLRALEKYAVRCGGGMCHRLGLYDAVLIKDNHLAPVAADDLSRWVTDAAARARALAAQAGGTGRAAEGLKFVEVEVDTTEQLDRVLSAAAAGASIDIVLLDNFTPDRLAEAVALRDKWGLGASGGASGGRRVALEASGGVNLQTVRAIAESGVERISVGALTHQAVSVDVGLDVGG